MTVRGPARHPDEATKASGKYAVLRRFLGDRGGDRRGLFLLALGGVLLPVVSAVGQLSNSVHTPDYVQSRAALSGGTIALASEIARAASTPEAAPVLLL